MEKINLSLAAAGARCVSSPSIVVLIVVVLQLQCFVKLRRHCVVDNL